MKNRFNLVDEKWIPIAGRREKASLADVFAETGGCEIAGNPIQKASLTKLLIAIAWASGRVADETDWKVLGPSGITGRCLAYLSEHHDDFYLYGEKPFLQMLVLASLEAAKRNELIQMDIPDLPAANASRIFDSQMGRRLDDGEKAIFIVMLMNHALAGKQNTLPNRLPPLTPGYALKTMGGAKAGPSIGGTVGRLFTFFQGPSMRETVWLNMLTEEDVRMLAPGFRLDVRPPWERMPEGEDDERAREIRNSIYAWLCAVSRFVLLLDDGRMCYEEGIQYVSSAKDGYCEPFMTLREKGKDVCVNVHRKPWRDFPAMLQISDGDSGCPLVRMLRHRLPGSGMDAFALWCGGLQVHSSMGGQYMSDDDDFVESSVWMEPAFLSDAASLNLSAVVQKIENVSGRLFHSVKSYWKDMGVEDRKATAFGNRATESFWRELDGFKDRILDTAWEGSEEGISKVMSKVWRTAYSAYDDSCPHGDEKGMLAWMKNRMGESRNGK